MRGGKLLLVVMMSLAEERWGLEILCWRGAQCHTIVNGKGWERTEEGRRWSRGEAGAETGL